MDLNALLETALFNCRSNEDDEEPNDMAEEIGSLFVSKTRSEDVTVVSITLDDGDDGKETINDTFIIRTISDKNDDEGVGGLLFPYIYDFNLTGATAKKLSDLKLKLVDANINLNEKQGIQILLGALKGRLENSLETLIHGYHKSEDKKDIVLNLNYYTGFMANECVIDYCDASNVVHEAGEDDTNEQGKRQDGDDATENNSQNKHDEEINQNVPGSKRRIHVHRIKVKVVIIGIEPLQENGTPCVRITYGLSMAYLET